MPNPGTKHIPFHMHNLFKYLLIFAAVIRVGTPASESGSNELQMTPLKPLWSTTYPEVIKAIAVSPDGGFVGVSIPGKVIVLDSTGKEMWSVEPRKISPYLDPEKLAVSPGGGWIMLAGNSSYRYVWKVSRNGARWFHKTTGTPQSISIDRSGDLIAVGTGGGHIYLLQPNGEAQRDIRIEGVGLADELIFSEDDRHIVLCSTFTNGVLSRDGVFQWQSNWWSIFPGRNLGYFAALSQASHGPPGSQVAMLNEKGETLWSRNLLYGDIRIAPNSEYSVISGVPITENEMWPLEPDPAVVSVINQKGETLMERSMPWHFLGFVTGDSQTTAIYFYDRQKSQARLTGFNKKLEPVWQIDPSCWVGAPAFYFAPNWFMSMNNTLSVYRLQ